MQSHRITEEQSTFWKYEQDSMVEVEDVQRSVVGKVREGGGGKSVKY